MLRVEQQALMGQRTMSNPVRVRNERFID